MSLLNRMLQDLDARQADAQDMAALPAEVRALPSDPGSRRPRGLGLLVVTAFSTAVYFFWPLIEGREVPPPASPAPREKTMPPETVVAPAEKNVQEVASEAVVAEKSTLGEIDGGLRMADALAVPSRKTSPPQVNPAPPEYSAVPVEASRQKPASAEKIVSPKVKAADDVVREKVASIERQENAGGARGNADGNYRKAISAVNQGRVSEAVGELRDALKSDGQHLAARQLLVKLLIETQQADEAIRVLHEGVQLLPAQSGWAMSLARLQAERGDFAEAWQVLERSMAVGGGRADYQGFSGHVLYRLGRHKEAAEHYQQAARLAPADGRWWLGLGMAYDAEGRVTEAREALLRAKNSGTLSPELLSVVEQKLR